MTAPAPIRVSGASKSLLLSSTSGATASRSSMIHGNFLTHLRNSEKFTLKAYMGNLRFKLQLKKTMLEIVSEAENGCDIFNDLKDRFLSFEKNKYMESIEHFQKLARLKHQRVCPSIILGFQPGEAFMIHNVGNLVPPFESGPSETNAALEFAVNALEVEHILVIGHGCCGGIRALMSMQDDTTASSFIKSWVVVGKNARIKTEAAASDLCFDQQCRHCEKESVHHSLLNLLSYPWIEEKVASRELFVRGGYYDFIDCSIEK